MADDQLAEIRTEDFLKMVLSPIEDSFIEIRAKLADGRIRQEFLRSFEEAARYGLGLTGMADVWFGVGPRLRRRGTKKDVGTLGAVWADLDFKLFDTDLSAKQALKAFPLPASIVVASGGGLQPYWLLDQPSSDLDAVEVINRGLTIALGPQGHPLDNVTDAARVLRLPGTTNLKYVPARPVKLTDCRPERRYPLRELSKALPSPTSQSRLPAASSDERAIPEGQRNMTLTSLAGSMRRRGMTGDEIGIALLAVNRHRCVPSLPEHEVLRIAASVSRYAPTPFPSAIDRRAKARARAML